MQCNHLQVLSEERCEVLAVSSSPVTSGCKMEARSLWGQICQGNSMLIFQREARNLEFHGESPSFRALPMNYLNAVKAIPSSSES